MNELYWLFGLAAAFLIGMAKAGIKGLGPFYVLLMSQVFGSKASTGLIVPLFVIGDLFAVIYYNRHTRWTYLWKLLPWMALGVFLGTWLGKDLPEAIFRQIMASLILVTVIGLFWWDRRKTQPIPNQWWFAAAIGIIAGVTTMVGNLAGAFTTIFFLAVRLPKNEFIGTAAWLYFIINLLKLFFHTFSWGTVNLESLKIDLYLLPATILGIITGVFLVKKIKDDDYRKFILWVTGLGALWVLFNG